MSEQTLTATSASTWRSGEPESRLQQGLDVPSGVGPRRRLEALIRRHHIRTAAARAVYADARAPEHGFPVATSGQALGFLGRMLRGRRVALAGAIVLNVAAAGAGLVAPYMLGRLIDQVTGGLLDLPGLTSLVSIIAGVIVAQALLTLSLIHI